MRCAGRCGASLWLLALLLAGQPAMGSEPKVPKGGPRLNAYFATGFDDAAWQRAAFEKVVKVWKPVAAPALGKKAVILATITREGSLLEARNHMPSGSKGWDDAALQAVRKAAPFAPLPKSWPHSSIEVHWHFENAK